MIKYDLHDSLIESVHYFADQKRVEIQIELCNWRQIGYKDSDPEILDVSMIFDGVEKYELSLSDHVFCGNKILHVTEEGDNTIEIIFLTDVNPETITIKAQEISFRTNDEMSRDHFVP